MFSHLNVKTRRIVRDMCAGKPTRLGGANIGVMPEGSRRLLAVLAGHVDSLSGLGGQDLITKVLELYAGFRFESAVEELNAYEDDGDAGVSRRYRVGKIRACSFRGLAPAGREWSFDFVGKSHLLYGPNGCGKSSLLGAICWCLTGRIFRDDCPPSEPEKISGYPADGETVGRVERDDAYSLIDENGNSSSGDEPYWVQIQLIGDDGKVGASEVWLKRHSEEGLSWGGDGENWTEISNVREAGVDELDAELHLVMPAKVSHLKFGKNPDLVRLLGDVVGIGQLETIADIAEGFARNARSTGTRMSKDTLAPEQAKIGVYVQEITELASETVKKLASYEKACGSSRTMEEINEFGDKINELIETSKTQLANDLGMEVPDKESEGYKQWKEESSRLPGQIHNLLTELGKSLEEVFATSLGFDIPDVQEMVQMKKRLDDFERLAGNEIKERLAWGRRERSDAKAGLMLKAAEHFPEGSKNCPVCTQALDAVPEVGKELEQLREASAKDYLQKAIEDYERSLIARLNEIIPADNRSEGSKSLRTRLNEDWEGFKKIHCKDLLLMVAKGFDRGVEEVAASVPETGVKAFNLPAEYKDEFEDCFSDYGVALGRAKEYFALCECLSGKKEDISKELGYLLVEGETESGREALKEILERAGANSAELDSLLKIAGKARELWKSVKKAKETSNNINRLHGLAGSADPVKELKQNVRGEVVGLVNGELGELTKTHYECLYDNEVLAFEKLTTGHAENTNIRDQFNLYLRAGQHQVPMGPFSNAGRMRALLTSFAFALLQRTNDSLGILILDDPALSLDDEHKARFVDSLVEPLLINTQVLLGTHYERFYDDSVPVFIDSVMVKMIPRRRAADQVEFEAGELLSRVQRCIDENSGQWREVAGNLRLWIEKTLATLSGYCPEPFFVHNDLRQSTDNYANITDRAIATSERDSIVQALRCRHVERIKHKLHHDEAVNRPDVEDALRSLQQCRDSSEKEVKRFKELYSHALAGRQRGEGTGIVLTVQQFTGNLLNVDVNVVREAAAAHNAQGIEWEVNDEYHVEGCPVVLLRSDVISPVGLVGQCLVLDGEGREAKNKDLVVMETDSGDRYVRRIWIEEDEAIVLEGANPTKPYKPIRIASGECKVRRVVGVLYTKILVGQRGEGEEWVPGVLPDGWFDNTVGIRVGGTSLEPVAQDGQIVLIDKQDVSGTIENDMLACVSVNNEGEYIKRCYVDGAQCILCAVNPTDREVPLTVDLQSIQSVYPLRGVLFEIGMGTSSE